MDLLAIPAPTDLDRSQNLQALAARMGRLVHLLRLINRLSLASGRSWTSLLAAAISFVRKMATHPQITELFRFIFLGTIVETGRKIAQKIAEFATDFFVVKAEFAMGDFAYDWVVNYLENHRVWNESRSFKVVARNAASRPFQSSNLGKIDGHPDPIYEPATAQSPSLFRWRGYWMSISKSSAGLSHYDAPEQAGGTLVLAVWSRNRHVLDEFVLAAREFYVTAQALPRKQPNVKGEPSGALLTANFEQSDLAYDWMLEYLRSSNALEGVMEYDVSTKQSNLAWGTGTKDSVRYMPSQDSLQRFLFKSPTNGRSTWLQVTIHTGIQSWESHRMIGGSITITLHSSDRDVLADLIECARQKYLENGTSRVTVHLTDNNGRWAKTVAKSRRALSTLILPSNIKETILDDAREFLASEKWYNIAGIPHRRGYLLYGAPGTGKSSTIHAVAGELGLEIYFISLASPGIDDFTLGRLISDTPSRCILLLEDIDCAFPSRDEMDDDEDEPEKDRNGNPIKFNQMMPPKSAVTLSGLLNVLDSVSSEEGRLTFATTNHIANLDAALIRAGRMDVKIKYGLATIEQIEQVFKVFFPTTDPDQQGDTMENYSPPSTDDNVSRYATEFAAAIPSEMYSIAQIQGYLLTKKQDPLAALQGVHDWLMAQQMERRALAEAKRRLRADMARWRRGFEEPYRGVNAWERLMGEIDQGATGPGDVPGAAFSGPV
ncbi:P-loop containing nucleoside triphosphate hydrolase protein [Mycena vulgaris]|nr:P-loop containing nucleoside triphosphate hydrolase protein [Mycena vulgaris]